MTYLPKESKVIYEYKDGKKVKVFDTSVWHKPFKIPLALPCRSDVYKK